MKVRYKKPRTGFVRVIRVQDMEALGIKDHQGEDLVFGPENNYTIEMSDELSESLVDRLPSEFVVGADEAPAASSSTGSDEGSPDESAASGDESVQQSTRKRRTGP